MLHPTPTHVPASHPDAELLALAPTLEAAVRECEAARIIAGSSPPRDSDHDRICEEAGHLSRAIDTLATTILAQPPRTLTGLVVGARAAAASCDDFWEEPDAELDVPARHLRMLCDNVFALAGIDRHGRPLSDAPVPLPSLLPIDPIFAAISHSRETLDAYLIAFNAPDSDTPEGDARASATGDLSDEAWRALLRTAPTTLAGAQALARYVPEHIERGGSWDETRHPSILFRAIGAADLSGEGIGAGGASVLARAGASAADGAEAAIAPDPAFAAVSAHRAAHAAWLNSVKSDDEAASGAALDRKNAAFKALLRTRPATEAGELAAARHALFEFAHVAIGCEIPSELAREAGRLVNRGFPVRAESLPPEAIEPTAAGDALAAAIEAHHLAYVHRLHSEVTGNPDAAERAEQEKQAFRTVLHSPLGSDAARTAYAEAVLGRACGAYRHECDGADRSSPLAVAYRNIAFGEYAPEPPAPLLMAAE